MRIGGTYFPAASVGPSPVAGAGRGDPQGDTGAHLFACRATVDMIGLTLADFVPQVDGIISVGEFYAHAAGGQIIFT
ncbi:MAG: hypothetical protein ACYC1P_14775 [Gaiellaceae bacterium]